MKLRLAILIALGLAQLAVPASMIYEQEQTVRFGKEYKFKTEPVDPYDAFRGRYVALSFTSERAELKGDSADLDKNINWGSKVYVAVTTDQNGFAVVEAVSSKPLSGENVFKATYRGGWRDKAVRLEFPFNKYFMEETRAPDAEKAYRSANQRNAQQKTWAAVRLLKGNAALTGLFIDGQPIREYLRDHPQKLRE